MPPKASPETAELIETFKSIGLSQAKAAEAAKSAKSAAVLKDLIARHDLAHKSLDEKQASLISSLAVSGSKLSDDQRDYVVSAVLDGRLKATDQVNGACARAVEGASADRRSSSRFYIQRPSNTSNLTRCRSTTRSLTRRAALVRHCVRARDRNVD